MMKAAVYSGTRNLYPHMVTAAKSLIANSGVEKIYFLIEDDKFPDELPPLIETVNVSGQKWFPADGPNMKSQFTYMALVRCCYPELFPGLDRILQLDVDTIVVDNIDELWDLDMSRKWIAMAEEKFTTNHPYGIQYFNCGVAMMNLDQQRKDDAMQQMVQLLNREALPYVEQDAWNKLGYPRKILEIPVRFNETMVTGFTEKPAIVHYAGFKNCWGNPRTPRMEYYAKYRDMTWKGAFACRGTEAPVTAPKKPRARKKPAES